MKAREHPSGQILAGLGCILAVAYFTKAAMFLITLVYIIAACIDRPLTIKFPQKSLAVLIPFLILVSSWIVALHQKQGTWTFGESGKINYAWEVCGASRSTHWQGEPGNIGVPTHPTRQIHSEPAVYEFDSPLNATYAPWFDPSYWYRGVSPAFSLPRQVIIFSIYLRYALALILYTPGLLLAVFGLALSSSLQLGLRRIRALWYLLLPSVSVLLLYALVYIDKRYVAASFLIIAMVLMSSCFSLITSKRWLISTKITAVVVCLISFGLILGLHIAFKITKPDAPGFTDQQSIIAEEMRSLGLHRGQKVAYIGNSMNAYWAMQNGVRIVTEIPIVYRRDGTLENYVQDDYNEIYKFWNLDAEARKRILVLMKKTGADAVVSDIVPPGTDTIGWHKLQGKTFSQRGPGDVFFQFLR